MRGTYFYFGKLVIILLSGSSVNTELVRWPNYCFRATTISELTLKNQKK